MDQIHDASDVRVKVEHGEVDIVDVKIEEMNYEEEDEKSNFPGVLDNVEEFEEETGNVVEDDVLGNVKEEEFEGVLTEVYVSPVKEEDQDFLLTEKDPLELDGAAVEDGPSPVGETEHEEISGQGTSEPKKDVRAMCDLQGERPQEIHVCLRQEYQERFPAIWTLGEEKGAYITGDMHGETASREQSEESRRPLVQEKESLCAVESPVTFSVLSVAKMLCLESSYLKLLCMTKGRNIKRCGVQERNLSRREFGEFHCLYSDLRQNPKKFFEYLRMSVSTFDYILGKIQSKLNRRWTNFNRDPIEPAERLVITLRYLVTGSSFRGLAFSFRMGSSTVAQLVKETTKVIWDMLQPIHMAVPTAEFFSKTAEEFYKKWNFPNCIGAIDGKQIPVKCPPHKGSLPFDNKKPTYIVLQCIIDANYKFIVIDVGACGKQRDGSTFRSSIMFSLLQTDKLKIPKDQALPSTNIVTPLVFLGDNTYPLMRNLLRPYSRQSIFSSEEYFNTRVSLARRMVRCAFDILSAKWHLLRKPIETAPDVVDSIVKCVCVLHNTILDLEGPENHLQKSDHIMRSNTCSKENNRSGNEALAIREKFKTFLCNNRIQLPKV